MDQKRTLSNRQILMYNLTVILLINATVERDIEFDKRQNVYIKSLLDVTNHEAHSSN